MAIKFSQFVVQTNASALSHIVGYNGADNIQITPTDFINSIVPGGPFLPLAGGTMTGNIDFANTIQARFLTSANSVGLKIQSSNTDSFIDNEVGDISIRQKADNKNIIFQSDDGSGGTATYLFLDGQNTRTEFLKDVKFPDNVKANFGNSGDLQIYHDGNNSFIRDITGTGDLKVDSNRLWIRSSIGETMGRFTENGSAELYYDNVLRLSTTNTGVTITAEAVVGNGTNGLQFSHSTGNSSGIINTGFSSTAVEIRTGNVQRMLINSTSATFAGNVSLLDSKFLNLGSNNDLKILHNSTDSFIINETGNFYISNQADDKDIIFTCDDGSGGTTTYFYLDGSGVITRVSRDFRASDSIKLQAGSSGDFSIYHNGTDSYLQNDTGDLYIKQNKSDADIIFQSDDGAGGETTYFYIDGSAVLTRVTKSFLFEDNIKAIYGGGSDLQIYHNSTASFINNETGDLNIANYADNKDIRFYSDDGAGSVTEYFRLDGLNGRINFSVDAQFADNKKVRLGSSADLQLYHTGSESNILNLTGNLNISNDATDGDIIFKSDDGSGGLATYFYLDGAQQVNFFSQNAKFNDNVRLLIGGGNDLQIYHDGSNSYINEVGAGDLIVKAVDDVYIKGNTHDMARFNEQGVKLYHIGNVKLETRSTGINILGVTEYADNTAAIAGGLITGDVYRTGDLLKIVH